jgi:MarR family transcriptional regulator, organic hydroperoxide resistance regulator
VPDLPDLPALFGELVRFEIELWNAVDARLRTDLGLPISHVEPMRIIAATPGCRVNDIAEDLSITVGGVSKIVDRLESAGHCRRRANPGDRRSSIIELTPEGRRRLAEAGTTVEHELERRLGSAVPPRSLQQFATTLSALRSASNAVPTGPTGPTRPHHPNNPTHPKGPSR